MNLELLVLLILKIKWQNTQKKKSKREMDLHRETSEKQPLIPVENSLAPTIVGACTGISIAYCCFIF